MQLMWLSGPTGEVKYISVTFRTVMAAGLALVLVLLLMGFLLHFVGLRIAFEYNPDWARSIGGVTSEVEQKRIESAYRANIDELRGLLQNTVNEVKQLEATKNRFIDLATPPRLKESLNKSTESLSKGGPLVSIRPFASVFRLPLPNELTEMQQDIEQTRRLVTELQSQWQSQLEWLMVRPTGLPLQDDYRMSSGFGVRNDPFTGNLAMHEGLDFVALVGAPVMATASGRVLRSEFDPNYGQVVDLQHADGYVTRYAHLQARLVKEGQAVVREQVIGRVGNTGRSTGPHLHYEIHHRDRPLNPALMLPRSPNKQG